MQQMNLDILWNQTLLETICLSLYKSSCCFWKISNLVILLTKCINNYNAIINEENLYD